MMNRVQVTFDNLAGSIGFIRQGKLRVLAVTSTTRSPALPDVPTLAEFVPGYEATAWYGVSAPRNTPKAVVSVYGRLPSICGALRQTILGRRNGRQRAGGMGG
jgi:tripartite-type tricarboxylate transporter receptor subunit TctC